MTLHRMARLAVGIFALCAVAACTTAPPPDTRAADEAALRKADEDWSAAAQSRNASAWIAFYGADAVVLPPNSKVAATPQDIAREIQGLMALPDLRIAWRATRVEVAKSGELGYVHGTYDLGFTGPRRKKVMDHGKYLEVWRKQADGSWKCIADMWSSDLPS